MRERRSIGQRVARAFVLSAEGVARVCQGGTRLARCVWYIPEAVALLWRLRRPFRGGGDPVVDEATVRQRVRALLDNGMLPTIRAREVLSGGVGSNESARSAGPGSAWESGDLTFRHLLAQWSLCIGAASICGRKRRPIGQPADEA